MSHSPAAKAEGGLHEGHDGDPARRPRGEEAPLSPPTSVVSSPSEPAASNDAGFVTYQSRKTQKKKNGKAAHAADPPVSKPSKPTPPAQPPSASAIAKGQTPTRAKPTALEGKALRLRDHVRKGADDQAVVDALARVQRSFRDLAAEEHQAAQRKFVRTYDAAEEGDRASIARNLREWFTGPHQISIREFLQRLTQFRLLVPAAAAGTTKRSWKQALLDDPLANNAPDGDSPMPSAAPVHQLWARKPREPTAGELQQMVNIARGTHNVTVLPGFVKATSSVTAAAFLASVATAAQRGTLVAQLGGAVSIPVNSSHADIVRMMADGATGPSKQQVEQFKTAVLAARYDAAVNALIFTTVTAEQAVHFAGSTLPIMGRMLKLKQLRSKTEAPAHVPTGAVVDLDVYDMQVWNLGGQLDALNIWHAFHGLLRLQVTHLEMAPAGTDGIQDLTLWNVSVASRGCPKILANKTKIVWGDETLWLHQTAHHVNSPCVKCGSATHPTRGCDRPGPTPMNATVTITGAALDAAADMAEVTRVAPSEIIKWLQDMERRIRHRSRRVGGASMRDATSRKITAPMKKLMETKAPAEIRECLLAQARNSAWLMSEHGAQQLAGTPGGGLEALPQGQLVDLISGRARSKEWRATEEYAAATQRFHDRVVWTEKELDIEPKWTRLQALFRVEWWRNHELSYRLAPPQCQQHQGFYDETIAFFRSIMNRAEEDLGDTDELMSEPQAEMETLSSSDPDAARQLEMDKELGGILRATWKTVRARNAEAQCSMRAQQEADAALDDVLAEVVAEMLTAVCELEVQAAMEASDAPKVATPESTSLTPAAQAPAAAELEVQEALESRAEPTAATPVGTSLTPAAQAAAPTVEEPVPKRTAQSSLQQAVAAAALEDMLTNNPFARLQRERCENPWASLAADSMGNATHAATASSTIGFPTAAEVFSEDVDIIDAMEEDDEPASAPKPPTSLHRRRDLALHGRSTSRVSRQLRMDLPVSRQLRSGIMGPQAVKVATAKAQASIERFLRVAPLATDDEVVLMGVRHAPPPPAHLPRDWQAALGGMGLREFSTPANGSCWQYALYCTQWGLCDEMILPVGVAKREAEYYRTGMFGIMDQNYTMLVETQVISEESLCQHFLQVAEVNETTRGLVRDEIRRAASQPCDEMIAGRYWTGPDGIRVTTLWLRQPIIVIDRHRHGELTAQLYTIESLTAASSARRESVRTTLLTHEQLVRLLAAYAKARVIPLVVALDHAARHFTGLRVEESRYEAYALKSKTRAAMKRRLGTLLKARGLHVPPARPATPLLATPFQTQESAASLYTPSSSFDASGSSTQIVPMRGPGAREMTRMATEMEASEDDANSATTTTLVVWSRFSGESDEERKTDTETWTATPRLAQDTQESSPWSPESSDWGTDDDDDMEASSAPLFQASLVTPLSPLDDADYIDLLAQISRTGPVPIDDEVALAKTMRDNKAAYVAWRAAAPAGIQILLASADTPQEACSILLHDTVAVLDMLRTLPWVPVLAGRVQRNLFALLGKDLIALGRARMLDRLAHTEALTAEARAYCADWSRGFAGLTPAATRHAFAQSPARWARLAAYVPARLRQTRSIPELEDDDWGALLTHLLVSPSALRRQLERWPLADACDALLSWTAHDRRVYHTVAAARAFQGGRWAAPTEYLAGLVELSQQRLPTDALASVASPPRGTGGVATSPRRDGDAASRASATRALDVVEPIRGGLQFLTQNVRGLAKTKNRPAQWFNGFRALQNDCMVDAVFLQETRATDAWVTTLEETYARAWGFDPGKLETPLSYWQRTPTAAGGVAILLHPQSRLRGLTPLWEDDWDSHFMALSGTVHGSVVTIVCIYAPVDKRARERLFRRLRARTPPGAMVVVGGDFNCVLDDERDRSRRGQGSADSPELRQLLEHWRLVDAISADHVQAQSHDELRELHAYSHTYSYQLRDGTTASSRLDRWYVSKARYAQVASTQTVTPSCLTDHDGVLLVLTASGQMDTRRSAGRRAVVYPLPEYAQAAVTAVSERHVQRLAELGATWTAADAAEQWDTLKIELRIACLTAKRLAAKGVTTSLNQRIRRAQRALAAEKRREIVTRDTRPTVTAITARFELLTLDSSERAVALRRHLILLQHEKSTRRQRRAVHKYDGTEASATRAFFRRMTGRYSRPRVVGTAHGPSSTGLTATKLAEDWLPIVQQGPVDPDAQDAFFRRLGTASGSPTETAFIDFSTAEVLAAIAACPAGKASGPDGIPNDWYKPVAAMIAPVMASTFSSWSRAGVLPRSFTEATVFCLPKVSSPQTGLDFRPISLLNTDYKIFSRMVLQRVKNKVESVVSAAQYGFVAHRQVHDAIDVWDALQTLVAAGELPPTATAVMLDFAKAYDTLDRGFLHRALEFHGFPRHVIAVVDAMHMATTARFLADGDLSDEVHIHNGIRQGCPLAPVLFIIALDLLYRAATRTPELPGLRLSESERVVLSGYADDTTAYLGHPREERALLDLLACFGAASGLRINVQKSRALAMHPRGPTATHGHMQIPVLRRHELHRHLGMAVASAPSAAEIWKRTLQQVRASLHLAHVKTTNLTQRIAICNAVVVPKLRFIGRHAWPSAQVLDQLQRFINGYAWHASLAGKPTGQRAWMSSHVAHLPVAHGGLRLPDVRAVFAQLSETVVARWRALSNGVTAAAGAVLLRLRSSGIADRTLGPSRRPTPQLRIERTLAATGLNRLRQASVITRDEDEELLLHQLLPTHGRGRVATKWWRKGWYYCRYEATATALGALRDHQSHTHGHFNLEALLQAPVVGQDVLHKGDGSPITRGDFPGLFPPEATIGDIIRLERVERHVLRFQCKQYQWPIPPRYVFLFRRFCDMVVHNYPAVLLPANDPDELQPRPPTEEQWRLRRTSTGMALLMEPVPGRVLHLGTVRHMQEAASLARQRAPQLQKFDSHPWLDGFAPIWSRRSGCGRRQQRLSHRAVREQRSRARRALEADATIGAALASVSWRRVAHLPASASRQRLLFHKIKGLRLSGYDRAAGRRGCPHCPSTAATDTGHCFHTVWHCEAAQVLWTMVRTAWLRIGVDFANGDSEFCAAVFSLRITRTPPVVWSLLARRSVPDDLIPLVHEVVTTVWQLQVLGCIQCIWQWRNSMADPDFPWSQAVATSALRGALSAAYTQAHGLRVLHGDHRRALRHLLHGLGALQLPATEPVHRPPSPTTDRFLLFFDGGSRGNPGPGGAGAVVVRVDAHGGNPSIAWVASMSLAHRSTTNNQAEYVGLVTGLRIASRQRLRPVTVIGDSAMIIAQLKNHKAPKHPRLRRLYGQARVLADELAVTSWRHHVRAYNAMADHAANVAMDSRRSVQISDPTAHAEWAALKTHLHGDVSQWQASTYQGPSSIV